MGGWKTAAEIAVDLLIPPPIVPGGLVVSAARTVTTAAVKAGMMAVKTAAKITSRAIRVATMLTKAKKRAEQFNKIINKFQKWRQRIEKFGDVMMESANR